MRWQVRNMRSLEVRFWTRNSSSSGHLQVEVASIVLLHYARGGGFNLRTPFRDGRVLDFRWSNGMGIESRNGQLPLCGIV
ncbi:hypothetical protein CEXT_747441 [Caerostris extrusa]|uniref:Uncharacterized protein n=1 Tax=Caerostris extrusa TaxID=172846 RepID=A0AAV4RTZ8_CAEEX|nr:hypothetical protein CEXT_747441 [Caerostris extrusa]